MYGERRLGRVSQVGQARNPFGDGLDDPGLPTFKIDIAHLRWVEQPPKRAILFLRGHLIPVPRYLVVMKLIGHIKRRNLHPSHVAITRSAEITLRIVLGTTL